MLLPVLPAVWLVGAAGITLQVWAAVVTALLAVVAAAWTLARHKLRHPGLGWLAVLVAWVALAAATRPVPRGEAAWLTAIAAIAWLLAVAASTPAGGLWSRWSVVALGLASSLWMVAERLAEVGRPGGPVGDPNRAATVAVLALTLLPGVGVSVWLRVATAVALIAGVLASGSRAALLALVVAAVVRALVAATSRVRRIAVAVVVIAATGLALRFGLDRDPLRFERLRIWGVALRTAVAELPLGAGPGGYRDAAVGHNFPRQGEFARYHRIPALAENDGLQLLVSLGLPGLVAGCGLFLAVVRRAWRRPEAAGVAAVLVVTSGFHSQLSVPLVGWSAALAVAAVWGRTNSARQTLSTAWFAAAAVVAAGFLAAALPWPRGGLLPDGREWMDEASRTLRTTPENQLALAGAEASAWKAAAALPRHPEAWRRLGDVRLQRAVLLRDPALATEAFEAYGRAADLNPLDVWAFLGMGRSNALLGRGAAARADLSTAVTLEPNCVPAWLELARVDLERGAIEQAQRSLRHAELALERSQGVVFVSSYERAMASPDPVLLARLRASLGGSR